MSDDEKKKATLGSSVEGFLFRRGIVGAEPNAAHPNWKAALDHLFAWRDFSWKSNGSRDPRLDALNEMVEAATWAAAAWNDLSEKDRDRVAVMARRPVEGGVDPFTTAKARVLLLVEQACEGVRHDLAPPDLVALRDELLSLKADRLRRDLSEIEPPYGNLSVDDVIAELQRYRPDAGKGRGRRGVYGVAARLTLAAGAFKVAVEKQPDTAALKKVGKMFRAAVEGRDEL